MKYIKKGILFCIIIMSCMFSFIGCNKKSKTVETEEATILGVEYSSIEQIILMHENTMVYYDLLQDYQVEFLDDLSTAFDDTAKEITSLDESLGVEAQNIDASVNNNSNYYVQIKFSTPQTITFKGNDEETKYECDSVFLDINDMKLHWSKDNVYIGTMGYTDSLDTVEAAFVNIKNNVIEMFAGFGDQN